MPGHIILGLALWSLIPGFIAKRKNRSFLGWFVISFVISPLISTIIIICIKCYPPTPIQYMMYCKECGHVKNADGGDTKEQTCPKCRSIMFSTGMTQDEFKGKTKEEKNAIVSVWRDQTDEYPLSTLPKYLEEMTSDSSAAELSNKDENTLGNYEDLQFTVNASVMVEEDNYSDKRISVAEEVNEEHILDIVSNENFTSDESNYKENYNFTDILAPENKLCPKCGKQYPKDGRFCPFCGEEYKEKQIKASNAKFCIYCGTSLPNEAAFCRSCGKKQPIED